MIRIWAHTEQRGASVIKAYGINAPYWTGGHERGGASIGAIGRVESGIATTWLLCVPVVDAV